MGYATLDVYTLLSTHPPVAIKVVRNHLMVTFHGLRYDVVAKVFSLWGGCQQLHLHTKSAAVFDPGSPILAVMYCSTHLSTSTVCCH